MRLIDADKAIGLLKTRLYETALNNTTVYCDASQLYKECADNRIEVWIDEIPTVEAEPVRHGHWVDDGERYGLDHELAMWECDQCGETIWAYLKDPRRWNYCPQCGSKMSEEVMIKLKRAKMDEVME